MLAKELIINLAQNAWILALKGHLLMRPNNVNHVHHSVPLVLEDQLLLSARHAKLEYTHSKMAVMKFVLKAIMEIDLLILANVSIYKY